MASRTELGAAPTPSPRRPRPAGRRPRNTASTPGEARLLSSNTHADARSQGHVVLDEGFDTPLADRSLAVQELDDLSMTFFRREVDGAFLIFVNWIQPSLCGYDGVHQ